VAPGEFRAPYRGDEWAVGDRPRPYRLLCLEHVRAFNAGYNFFSGMSPDEIHDAQKPFGGWERETRAFTGNGGADRPPKWADFSDPLDAISARFRRPVEVERRDGKALSGEDRRALKTLGLEIDVDRTGLRKKYSELVRRFHPDRNGGDRTQERALQEVIAAYQLLKGSRAFS